MSVAETFERLVHLEDVDLDLASLEKNGVNGKSPAHGMTAGDLAEVRSLFAELAAHHVRQVRDFMIDLRLSEATVDWIGICEPALRSLRRAAEKLDLAELCVALDRFCEALAGHRAAGIRTVDSEQRQTLLARYEELSALMPQAFALDLDADQREAAIVQSLLLQIPDVKKSPSTGCTQRASRRFRRSFSRRLATCRPPRASRSLSRRVSWSTSVGTAIGSGQAFRTRLARSSASKSRNS